MLYTLHWLILDASSECDVAVNDSMHQMSSIQLFVYLFAPLLQRIERKHFSSLKLQSGLLIWEALWEYSQPDIACMNSPVKPRVEGGSQDQGKYHMAFML